MPEAATRSLTLPADSVALEEANLASDVVRMAGQEVLARVLPEEMPATRNAQPGERLVWIGPDGNRWNDYAPLRVIFQDSEGRDWRLPRRWLLEPERAFEGKQEQRYEVLEPVEFVETLHLPNYWDLLEINILESAADDAAGQPTQVVVSLAPGAPVKVQWYDSGGVAWRIPHDWRRRRVRLPNRDILIDQGVPRDVAEGFSNRVVSVNYHPGSLCCLPNQYRFRDADGRRHPVNICDCFLMGYGDAPEHLA